MNTSTTFLYFSCFLLNVSVFKHVLNNLIRTRVFYTFRRINRTIFFIKKFFNKRGMNERIFSHHAKLHIEKSFRKTYFDGKEKKNYYPGIELLLKCNKRRYSFLRNCTCARRRAAVPRVLP